MKKRFFIYQHINESGECIYVGSTTNMHSRQKKHLNKYKEKIKIIYSEVPNLTSMEIYERYYINELKPVKNKTFARGDNLCFMKYVERLEFKEYTKEKHKRNNTIKPKRSRKSRTQTFSLQTLVDEETKVKVEEKVKNEGDTESGYLRRLVIKDLKRED